MSEIATSKITLPSSHLEDERKRRRRTHIFSVVLTIFLIIIALFSGGYIFIVNYYTPVFIDGASMQPTLNNFSVKHEQEIVDQPHVQLVETGLMDTSTQRINKIKRNDIVVFEKGGRGSNNFLVKRVIALPLQTIHITNNSEGIALVTIKSNGSEEVLNEFYLSSEGQAQTFGEGFAYAMNKDLVLQENEYFLMGDNRGNSQDSRTIGPVKYSDITGVLFVINGYAKYDLQTQKLYDKKTYAPWKARFY